MLRFNSSSHYILLLILISILFAGTISAFKLTSLVHTMAKTTNTNLKNTMDPYAPDPGKTKPEKYEVGPETKRVSAGVYLERIEDLDIKQSSWTYEFYLWFNWNPNDIDFLGKKNGKQSKDEIPFSIINGEILKISTITELEDYEKNIGYVQYLVKAKNTQFFDVSLYPIDQHDLIIPIEHKWLDRESLVFVPDTVDTKVSSRASINGYEKSFVKIIEKPHAYQSTRGNPQLKSGFKVDFSQIRMAMRVNKGGVSVILKLFIIMYIAVIVTFIAPFSTDPSRYTVGSLFTTAGANYILSTKLPPSNLYTLAELINTFCMIIIIVMMFLLAFLPSVIFRDGTMDRTEKRLNNFIIIVMFGFFVLINILLSWQALGID